MRGAALHALRRAFDLDRSAVGHEARRVYTQARSHGRTRESASQEEPCEGACAGLHSPPGISGRSGGVRGPVQGWAELSQPESISGRHARGSGGAVYAGGGRDLCADSHCVFASAAGRGTLPARRGVCETADGWGLAEREDFLSRADREYQARGRRCDTYMPTRTWITGPAKTT